MNNFSRLALLPLPLLLICAARAEFNPSNVAADAQWVVAVDLNELRDSTLGKGLLDLIQKQITAAQASQAAARGQPPGFAIGDIQINFQKLFETVGTVTAYGSNFSPDPKLIDGALILQGTADLRKIAEAVAIQSVLTMPDKVTEVKDLPFEAYAIGGEVIIAFPPEPVILVSKSKAQLLKARDVVRGTAPSLAQANSAPLAQLLAKSSRSFFVAASVVPTDKLFAAGAPQTRILQLVNSGMIAIGEEEPRTVAHLQLIASSDETADKLLKIIQGMVAMMSLAETTDKQLAEFLQSAVVEKQDRTVNVQLAYSSERLVQMIQNVQQQVRPLPAGLPEPALPATTGKVVAEWSLGQATPGAVPGAALLTDHAVENVSLTNGSTITLTGRRDLTGFAIFDFVEIMPASGSGPSLRFEAENMRLRGYRIQNAPYASHGKVIVLNNSFGTAQFEFPGEDGTYQVHVHYVEQPPGKTSMAVNVKNPDAMPMPMPASK